VVFDGVAGPAGEQAGDPGPAVADAGVSGDLFFFFEREREKRETRGNKVSKKKGKP
jgi:hypothetical protein